MATKKKTTEESQDQTPDQQTAPVEMEETASEQATSEASPDPKEDTANASPEVPSAPEDDAVNVSPGAASPASQDGPVDSGKLENFSVLADRHRVVGWQQAALLRLMGWEDDKRVSDAEYRAALEHLKNRRIGGGRR